MKKLYTKSELTFAIVFIVIYCLVQTLAINLSTEVGINSLFEAIFNIIFAAVLFILVRKNGLLARYGLCKGSEPARKLLWYLPLLLLMSNNLWNGITVKLPAFDALCYLISMLCVGFLEELIFRGFLFKAMAKNNLKSAVIVSSITFGIGHLLNLVNGSGMGLVSNLCQVCGAIAIGFLFVTIFHRGGSLIPCIITHSVINMLSAFADETGMDSLRQIAFSLLIIVISVAYTLFLNKSLPAKEELSK